MAGALFAIAFWLTWQLLDYEELGDYLIRLGLGWLFLTFLSFVAFSAVVSALSTFFLSEDLRLLLPAPVPAARLFHSRFARTVGQAGWMVVAFVLPVLLGLGLARCAPAGYYLTALATVVPFVVIPSALGCLVTLGLVSVFPARRARDVLMLMGLLFAVALILLVRFLRPERLLERPVAARRDGLLRDAPVAGDAAAALLLGRREPVRGAPRPGRPRCTWARSGRAPPRSPSSRARPTGATTSRPGARPRRPARRASPASPSSIPCCASSRWRPRGARCW